MYNVEMLTLSAVTVTSYNPVCPGGVNWVIKKTTQANGLFGNY